MSVNTDAVACLYTAIDAGQPDGRAAVMASDAVQRWPQSREVLRGLDRILETTRRRSSVPRVRVAELVEADDRVIAQWSADYGDGKVWRNVSLFRLGDGLMIEEIDYFGDPFDGPAWRADLVEIEDLPRPATS